MTCLPLQSSSLRSLLVRTLSSVLSSLTSFSQPAFIANPACCCFLVKTYMRVWISKPEAQEASSATDLLCSNKARDIHMYLLMRAEIALCRRMSPVLEEGTNYEFMTDGLTDGLIDSLTD